MAAQLEISTVAAVKSIQTLRQQTTALAGVIKGLTKEIGTLQGKMKGAAVDGLSKKIQAQSKQIAQLATRVKNATNMSNEFARAQKKAEVETGKMAIKLAKAESATAKLTTKQKAGAAAAKLASAAQVKSAAATLKMKNAAFAAGEQFKSMAQKLKLAGASQDKINGLKNSLTALDKKLKIGKLTTSQYDKAMRLWKTTLGKSRRELIRLADAERKQTIAAKKATSAARRLAPAIRRLGVRTRRTEREVSGLTRKLRNFGSSAVFAVGPLSGIGARVSAFGAITTRAGVGIALMAIAVASLIIGVVKLAGAMIRANVEMTRIENALKVATGSTQAADREFKFLVVTSRELALNLPVVAGEFGQLSAAARGTTLASEGVRNIFVAMSKASIVLSLSADQTRGAFRALQQMISKGTVQAEELRGQLGERLPGAFQIAARAMGVTTRELGKLMEQGLVRAAELLPKLAAEMEKTFDPQVADAIETWTGATNKLATEWFLFLNLLEEKTGAVNFLQGVLTGMAEALKEANEAGSGFTSFKDRLAELDEGLAIVRSNFRKAMIAQQAFTDSTDTNAFKLSKLRDIIVDLRQEENRLLIQRKKLNREDTSKPLVAEPRHPLLITDEALDLPVTSVNRFQDSLSDLTKVMATLSDESIDLQDRLDMRDELNRTASAVSKVNKVMKGLSDQEEFALRLQFASFEEGMITTDQLRERILKLIIDEANLQNTVKDMTQELNKQSKAAKKLGTSFEELILELDTVQDAMETAFAGGFIEKQFVKSLSAAKKMLLKFSDESIAIFARSSSLVSQQTFDSFISAEGLQKTEAFAKILGVVEQELGSILRAIDDAEGMVKVFRDTRSEAEKFNLEMENLEHLLGVYGEFPEKVEAIQRAMVDLNAELIEGNVIFGALESGLNSLGSSFVDVLKDGKDAFRVIGEFVQSLLEGILKLIFQLSVVNPILNSITGRASPSEGGSGLPTGFANTVKEFVVATQRVAKTDTAFNETAFSAVKIMGVELANYAKSETAIADVAFMKVGTLVTGDPGGSSGGGILSSILSAFTGGFGGSVGTGGGVAAGPAGGVIGAPLFLAKGGHLSAGQTAIVGEEGPEKFTAGVSGFVTPNNAQGGTTVVHQTFDFRGASLEAVALLKQEAAAIQRATLAAVDRNRRRGISR